MATSRLDVELVSRGLLPSRERARAAILAGDVTVDGTTVTKAGAQVSGQAEIAVELGQRYVSRGGHKLAGALDEFAIDPAGARVLDVGASTGGFTDCLLQRGAASVTALDVGYGQLAWSLRTDERVRVFERTNIRAFGPAEAGDPFDLVTVDVSFIGLEKVLPHLVPLLASDGQILGLVKPQFEACKGRVGKKGVVLDAHVHEEVLARVAENARAFGLVVRGLSWSPIKGPEGNIEFWLWLARRGEPTSRKPAEVVAAAHEALGD